MDGVLELATTDSAFSSGQFGVTVFRATAEFDDLSARVWP